MRRPGGLFLIAGLLLFAAPSPNALGEVLEPTRFDDPPPGACKPKDCSLREALIDAEQGSQTPTTVRLEAGTYRLELPTGSNEFKSGDFDIFDPITITGKGPDDTTVSGELLDRVFDLNPSSGVELPKHRILHLKIKKGLADTNDDEEGGGIRAFISELRVDDVTFSRNFSDFGGAIGVFRAQVTVTRSTFSNNEAQLGGAIMIPNGAAIPNTLDLRTSTISDGQALEGGGLALKGDLNPPAFDQMPVADIVNSTFAGNEAFGDGGGILGENGGVVDAYHITAGFNRSDADDTGGGSGGGIYQASGTTFQLNDSVLASNGHGTTGADNQCSGSFLGAGNAINAVVGCSSFPIGPNTIPASQIASALADNGGPTKTMALTQGSAAIGFANGCPNTDQRGKPRPDADCDSGAFERKGD